MTQKTRWFVLALIVGSLVLATGCNTVRGVGKDIEQAGKAIQKADE